MGWGESVYLSILEGTCTVHCTQRPVESEHLFLAGKLFLCFFLDRVGELAAAAAEEKVFWFFLYLFFGGGVFGTAAAGRPYLALPLSFFPGRASLEEDLEERKRGEKGSIRYISQRSSFGLGRRRREKRREKETRTFREVGRKSIWFFCIYIFIYIYILFSCI